jgi:L-lactate dehydrogenase (cytochrome)
MRDYMQARQQRLSAQSTPTTMSDSSDSQQPYLNGNEVANHKSRSSCWVIIAGKVYDVTEYLDSHPGGSQILLQYGGKDATAMYAPIHPSGTIERSLPKDKHLGAVDPATVSTPAQPQVTRDLDQTARIPLSHCLNLNDVEKAATRIIDRASYVYFSSAADSLGSLANNHGDWKKITLRPRIMRNVRRVDMSRTMLGKKFRLPFFISPAARARLVHEDGELLLSRGAARWGIPYCPSTYSTVPHDELMQSLVSEKKNVKFRNFDQESEGGQLWFQLYVAHEKDKTIEIVSMARDLGYKALVITVDTPVVGKREEDERYRAELATASGDDSVLTEWYKPANEDDPNAPPLRGHHSSTLNWDDLSWITECWRKGRTDASPIVIKGIQTAEDAALAVYEYHVDAIYLSNHGGRQCDDAPSSIRTLLEIRKFYPELLQKCEVYVDGGVRRGADILKALALGARGCGLGRPFMYACSMGDDGVAKTIQRKCAPCVAARAMLTGLIVLSEEIETTMRCMGITSLDQLNPSYVNTKVLEAEIPDRLWNESQLGSSGYAEPWVRGLKAKL